MIHFNSIDKATFLRDYWQKKPLLIKQALPSFISPLSPEELAGLSLEEEVESRLVIQKSPTDYELKHGAFTEETYAQLPKKDWTLLIQGADRLIPEVHQLVKNFEFIPRWRLDDVMVSYATTGGNVGPHYDHYDVFLLQGAGTRKWQLTSQNCNPENYLPDLQVRLMQEFNVEEEYILETGDLLYLPPLWGHHGIALDDECITYSFGYRSYQGQELWDSLGDFIAENELFKATYQDPSWENIQTAEVPLAAAQQAKSQIINFLEANDSAIHQWFTSFASQLDQKATEALPEPLEQDEQSTLDEFTQALQEETASLEKDQLVRFVYRTNAENIELYINGYFTETPGINSTDLQALANQQKFNSNQLQSWAANPAMTALLYQLWQKQFIVFA